RVGIDDADARSVEGLAKILARIARIGLSRKRVVQNGQRLIRVIGSREVALSLRQGRDGLGPTAAGEGLSKALVGPEEVEMLAPPHRPADVSAKLVSFEFRPGSSEGVIGPAIRVQVVVAQKIVGLAVETGGPALGDHADHAALGLAELRVVAV